MLAKVKKTFDSSTFDSVVDIVEDEMFRRDLGELIKVVKPFAIATIDLQSANANPASALVAFKRFEQHAHKSVSTSFCL